MGNSAEGAEKAAERAQKRRRGFVAGTQKAQKGQLRAAGGVGLCWELAQK